MYRVRTFLLATLALCVLAAPAWANSLPVSFLPPKWSDVDKTHTGTTADGAFTGITSTETNRCWQAAFANMLYKRSLTADAQQTYDAFVTSDYWPNVGTTAAQQETLFETYFAEQSLLYFATDYYDTAHVNFGFAAQEIYRCQGVKLGVGDAGGAYHAITFWGWNAAGESWISDSDADWLGGDAAAWTNSTEGGRWHIKLYDDARLVKDYTVWNIVTVCPVPEPVTMLGVFLGVSGVGAYLSKRVKTAA